MSESSAMRNERSEQHGGLAAAYGFVPNLFRGQSKLPRAVEAEELLIEAVVLCENKLARRQKERLLQGVASAQENDYCLALYANALPAVSAEDVALLKFALKLSKYAPWFSGNDVEDLRKAGFDEGSIVEAAATTALGQMLCTLADGLRPAIDSELASPRSKQILELPESSQWIQTAKPYLPAAPHLANDFAPYVFLREQFGFVPNIFRIQSLRPELIEAEAHALERIMLPEDGLSRVQKENIFLVISATNLATCHVAMQTQILTTLGVPPEDSDQVVADHRQAALSPADKALLEEVRKLARCPRRLEGRFEWEALRAHGFSEPAIVEAVVVSALANFLNTLQAGLGPVPDFAPRRVFTPKDLYPLTAPVRPISDTAPFVDPDAALVKQVQSGDAEAFEELVRRHTRRVFGILAGLVENVDDAREATQEVFLKAFEHIDRFEGRSKFSTWLTSIAINTGTELLRQRKPSETLEEAEDDEGFRPRQVRSWAESPEQLVTASQMRQLVREAVFRLPQKYRVVVLLRDINQLSTEEASAALGLSVSALKARLLRGRLMLRESLAAQFAPPEKESADAQLR